MTNMSHCRFENTYNDLLDCKEQLELLFWHNPQRTPMSSEQERAARRLLIGLCFDIVGMCTDEGIEVDDLWLSARIADVIEKCEAKINPNA